MSGASYYRRSLATLVFLTFAAGDFWRYLLSWWGWGALVVLLWALVAAELVRSRAELQRVPLSLSLFLAFATVSIAWSAYPLASALGALTTIGTAVFGAFLALCLPWRELLDTLATALRWILGLSLAFELVVATVVRAPLLPFWVDYSHLEKIPMAFYWSRNLLFEGGRIQGIVGNANLLGMLSLLALIVFTVRVLARKRARAWGVVWIAVALATFALTRSSTVIVAAVVVVLATLLLLAVRRTEGRARAAVYIAGLVVTAGAVLGAVLGREQLLGLLGKSPDLTNRLDIWQTVGDLALERPVVGWGWVSYWAPWVDPFQGLIVINGVEYLQAHNVWLDVFLQLGVIGLAIFVVLCLGALVRSWALAAEADRIRHARASDFRWPETAAPVLLFIALLVQSFAESRLIIELGFVLLVVVATKSAWRDDARVRADA